MCSSIERGPLLVDDEDEGSRSDLGDEVADQIQGRMVIGELIGIWLRMEKRLYM